LEPGHKACAECLRTCRTTGRYLWRTNAGAREGAAKRRRTPEARERARRFYQFKKDKVFEAYGGYVCACCGEKRRTMLTIDHVNNDGAAHRRTLSAKFRQGIPIYSWLEKNDFPSGFQTQCWNCNGSKKVNGRVVEPTHA